MFFTPADLENKLVEQIDACLVILSPLDPFPPFNQSDHLFDFPPTVTQNGGS